MSKVFILIMMTIVFSQGLLADTTVTETSHSFKIEYKNSKDAAQFYDGLKFPFFIGDAVTGVKHEYKFFTDSTNSLSIYCDASDLSRKRCIIDIAKKDSTPLVAITHDEKLSTVVLYDKSDVLKIIAALNVAPTNHGGFLFKLIAPDDLNSSVACLEKMDDPEWKQCEIKFFHQKAF